MLMNLVLIVAGLALLTAGGEILINAALSLARKMAISPLLCGLLIVGFGTSAPELAVSVDASLRSLPDIAVGNVVGSNISNSLLIIGLCAVLAPLAVQPLALWRDASAGVFGCLLFCGIVLWHAAAPVLGLLQAAIMLFAFALYIGWAIHSERNAVLWSELPAELEGNIRDRSTASSVLLCVIGLVLLIGGSRMLVNGAAGIAQYYAVPEVLIGLTLVAVGTSLPELVVSIMATIRGQSAVAVGNVLGSNLFNLLFILPVAAFVNPLAVSARIAQFDAWAMLAAVLLLMTFLVTGRKVSRIEGAILLAGYVAYLFAGYRLFGAQVA
ncbi:MAG: calcium/sodium antiporter [Pseudomonadales bacterium]